MQAKVFEIYPAIDLRDGQVVRLVQGDPQRQTVYEADPGAAALRWMQAGARWVHVVSLDDAFNAGQAARNQAGLAAIVAAVRKAGRKVQFGGGLRTLGAIENALAGGVSRAILGTAAVENPDLVEHALQRFGGEAIGVALDARDGIVQVRGWQQSGGIRAIELAQRLARQGVQTLIYTDIARDGLAVGANLAACQSLLEVLEGEPGRGMTMRMIASGGIHSLADIRAARQAGLAGVIIGRALYQGDFTLEEALTC
jgi:phosphoribosylformimino-5-aminoimidazole carboxamide ribotide isomerase